MMKRTVLTVCIALAVLSMGLSTRSPAEDIKTMGQAIEYLKTLDPEKIPEEEQQEAADTIDAAWKRIRSHGSEGIRALKKEVNASQNDYFRLNACALLWDMRKLKESEYIAGIWASTDLSVNYNYVFFTAFEAAKTGDAKALPMLRALLRDKKGDTFIPMHSLTIRWPLSHEFIWGAYGPKGIPALLDILRSPSDDTTLESAIVLMPKFQSLEALPKIRDYATRGTGDVQLAAVRAVGQYGHPDDYAFLIQGLKSKDTKKQFHHTYALYEYEDLRAVPHIVPLLQSNDPDVVYEAVVTLAYLVTPEGVDALMQCSGSSKNTQTREHCSKGITYLFGQLDTDAEKYGKLSSDEKANLCNTYLTNIKKRYYLQEGDKKLTRKKFLKIVKKMKKANRITLDKYEWVEDRHFLAVATPDDIDLLADLRASLYPRLSDECLYETRILDSLIQQLGRSRYRKSFGIGKKVE